MNGKDSRVAYYLWKFHASGVMNYSNIKEQHIIDKYKGTELWEAISFMIDMMDKELKKHES